MNKFSFFLISAVFSFFSVSFAQNSISYNGDRNYTLVERTDLSRYDNGKYSGLVAREVRSFITRSDAPDNSANKNAVWYNGNFYLTEQTVHAKKEVIKGIHDSIPSVFNISADGKLSMVVDNGFPSFRSFPAFPGGKLTPGATWQANAIRAVDPLNKGIVTKLQMLVAYTFVGEEKYHGEDVFRITAKWATRYDMRHLDFGGDKNLENATGTHDANILVSKKTGCAILIHDRLDETFTYKDGLSVRLKGTISQFTEYPPAVEHKALIPALQRIAKFVPAENSSSKISGADDINAAILASNIQQKTQAQGGSSAQNSGLSANSKAGTSSYGKGQNSYSAGTSAKYNSGNYNSGSGNAPNGLSASGAVAKSNSSVNSAKQNNTEKISAADLLAQSGYSADKKNSSKIEKEAASEEKVELDDFNSMVVEETAAGLRLSVRDIRFKPDSAEILPEELGRLDQIAEVLKLVPDSHFLVEGHSASVGNPRGELEISEQRAKAIALQLAKRGIPAEHFICRGFGAEKPVADNKTAKGKAQNRRVEITILE